MTTLITILIIISILLYLLVGSAILCISVDNNFTDILFIRISGQYEYLVKFLILLFWPIVLLVAFFWLLYCLVLNYE